jgi:hypothetical protein
VVQQPLGNLAPTLSGVARHQLTGTPSGLASTYSLRPQYQRRSESSPNKTWATAKQTSSGPTASAAGPSAAGFQQLIDGDVQSDDEVVETGMHEASLEVDVAVATPTLGGLVTPVIPRRPRPNSASVI